MLKNSNHPLSFGRAMGATRLGARAAELVERAGPKPQPGLPESRAEALSFWAACLLPMAPAEQQTLLDMTDSAERLRYGRPAPLSKHHSYIPQVYSRATGRLFTSLLHCRQPSSYLLVQ